MDPPEQLVSQWFAKWTEMVKSFKGLPGANPERYAELLQPKHCALSLVGEPIMYPAIGSLVNLLHEKKVSTFLVTNGQNPECFNSLTSPLTQLYVSVDAPDQKTLKDLGRPIFKDFWPRLLESLDRLKERKERTVVRLTLLRERNDEDVEGYTDLILRAKPCFVELKSFTFPGPTENIRNAGLSIKDVPPFARLQRFALRLCQSLNDKLRNNEGDERTVLSYEAASWHVHTNSILLARRDFYIGSGSRIGSDPDKYLTEETPSSGVEAMRCALVEEKVRESTVHTENRSVDSIDGSAGSTNESVISYDEDGVRRGCNGAAWQTWIDFEKFFKLAAASKVDATEYTAQTPTWACSGDGFDPQFDVRSYEKQMHVRRQHEAAIE